ncbi:MAG: pilus assembly protein PilM [Planctomycetes bacterium]|nr:pilus assembly protein PilM [Planctomycetota bacterium]
MPRTVTGVDIGKRTAKFLRGYWKDNTFHATGFAISHHAEGTVSAAWKASELGFKPTDARIGLTGRDVNIRYTRVPRVPDWQLRKLMRFEVEEVGGQSGSEVASDFNVLPNLPEVEGEDVVLLAMARESLLAEHLDGLAAVGGKVDAFTPLAIALYNAYLRFAPIEDQTVLVANVGHENLDVILARGPDLLFARNLTGGSSLFDTAIGERFGVAPHKAEELKKTAVTLAPGAVFKDGNQEKASRAAQAAAGQLLSLLQSTVMFCKSQVNLTGLRVDKVLLCGGGAALEGLPRYLQNALNVPVELFDPFTVVDTTALKPDEGELLDEHGLESVAVLGLATMASDPDAYSIEILPRKVARAREFSRGTVFLIAAGVLAAGFLGWEAWRTNSALGDVKKRVAAADAALKRADAIDRKTRELSEEGVALAERARQLAQLAGSGEQVARVLAALATDLPRDFWVTQFSSETRFDDALGIPRGSDCPIVHVEGRAQEGTESTSVLFEGLVRSLDTRLGSPLVAQKLSNTGDKFTLDLTTLGFREQAPATELANTGGGK